MTLFLGNSALSCAVIFFACYLFHLPLDKKNLTHDVCVVVAMLSFLAGIALGAVYFLIRIWTP